MYFFAFLDAELVAKGFTRTELIDAIAVGQFRQGPFSPLSLCGLSNQWIRAFISTLAIFYPFVFVAIESYGKK
jgi:hypothetical protein